MIKPRRKRRKVDAEEEAKSEDEFPPKKVEEREYKHIRINKKKDSLLQQKLNPDLEKLIDSLYE